MQPFSLYLPQLQIGHLPVLRPNRNWRGSSSILWRSRSIGPSLLSYRSLRWATQWLLLLHGESSDLVPPAEGSQVWRSVAIVHSNACEESKVRRQQREPESRSSPKAFTIFAPWSPGSVSFTALSARQYASLEKSFGRGTRRHWWIYYLAEGCVGPDHLTIFLRSKPWAGVRIIARGEAAPSRRHYQRRGA